MFVTPCAGVWIEIYYKIIMIAVTTASLPVRECGLKFPGAIQRAADALSLPVRECGLKLIELETENPMYMSLPVRECGLKWIWKMYRVC